MALVISHQLGQPFPYFEKIKAIRAKQSKFNAVFLADSDDEGHTVAEANEIEKKMAQFWELKAMHALMKDLPKDTPILVDDPMDESAPEKPAALPAPAPVAAAAAAAAPAAPVPLQANEDHENSEAESEDEAAVRVIDEMLESASAAPPANPAPPKSAPPCAPKANPELFKSWLRETHPKASDRQILGLYLWSVKQQEKIGYEGSDLDSDDEEAAPVAPLPPTPVAGPSKGKARRMAPAKTRGAPYPVRRSSRAPKPSRKPE